MKSIWETTVENNTIRIENNWFSGEKLFVNEELQDLKQNLFASDLEGQLYTSTNEKKTIKVRLLQNLFSIGCVCFVNDKQIALKQIK